VNPLVLERLLARSANGFDERAGNASGAAALLDVVEDGKFRAVLGEESEQSLDGAPRLVGRFASLGDAALLDRLIDVADADAGMLGDFGDGPELGVGGGGGGLSPVVRAWLLEQLGRFAGQIGPALQRYRKEPWIFVNASKFPTELLTGY
jgi:hypothetical protein